MNWKPSQIIHWRPRSEETNMRNTLFIKPLINLLRRRFQSQISSAALRNLPLGNYNQRRLKSIWGIPERWMINSVGFRIIQTNHLIPSTSLHMLWAGDTDLASCPSSLCRSWRFWWSRGWRSCPPPLWFSEDIWTRSRIKIFFYSHRWKLMKVKWKITNTTLPPADVKLHCPWMSHVFRHDLQRM